MEGPDNIMSILRSIAPIKYKYSKENRALDKTFKSMSLESLMRNVDSHIKPKDEFAPSPEYLKNKNKYEINFKNSEEYKERYEERLKKLKLWKESQSNIDILKYHPNYDFVRKKVFCVHIRPPTVKKIRTEKPKIDNNEIKEKKQNENNTVNININNININERKRSRISIPNLKNNQSEITFDKNKNETNSNSVTITLNNIPIINLKENGSNKNNNSFIFNDSNSNRSNSSKMREIYSNNSAAKNFLMNKAKIMNLKNKIKLLDRNSSNNSDYNTNEINKSTNIEELSFLHQEKEKFNRIQSNKNLNNNISLPKIRKKIKK